MYDRVARQSAQPLAGTSRAATTVDAITRLQQSAGNHAVATLMRLGTGEHAQLGGNRQVTINGVTMTEGEVITLGDFYLTPARIYEAPKAELEHLLLLIRQDTKYKQGVKGVTKVKQSEWEDATKGHAQGETYKQLAFDNDTHFGPDTRSEADRKTDHLMTRGPWATVPARKGDHRSEWERYHREATVEARVEALGGAKTVPEKAVVLNGFASHFLTDAFSAGHLYAKSQIMDFARRQWLDMGANETWFDIIPESSFTVAVAEKLLDHPKSGPKLRGYQIRIVQWGDMSVTKLSEMIYGLQDQAPEVFYSMFAGIVHDALNDAIEKDDKAGLPDIMVVNARGDGPWSLPGDGNLAKSPETVRIAKAAVEESYRNLELAVADPRGFDVEKAVERVWAYAPRPTPQTALLIGKVIADYADVSEPKTQQAAADYLIDNIDDVIDGLLKRNRIRVPVPQKPMPAPYPRPRMTR